MHATRNDGVDAKFVEKLRMFCSEHRHLSFGGDRFIVKHYAGDVAYDSVGFCAANKDALTLDTMEVIQQSGSPLLQTLFKAHESEMEGKPSTAGFKIRTQAQALVKALKECTPHYVRCMSRSSRLVSSVTATTLVCSPAAALASSIIDLFRPRSLWK